MKLDTDI